VPETEEKGIRETEEEEKGIRITETGEKGIRVTEEENGNIVEQMRRRLEYLFLYKHIPWT
jgi:hypothetical protein